MLIIEQLWCYPLKSAAGICVESLQIDACGPQGDREWMLVDAASGLFLSQRQLPAMTLLHVQPTSAGLQLCWQGQEAGLDVVLSAQAEAQRKVTVWGDKLLAIDAGDEAAQWLSVRLQRDLRLVRFAASQKRALDPAYHPEQQCSTRFSDGFPLLLAGSASLAALNAELVTAVDMRRFRPNIVVSGAEAYAEDGWHCLRTGSGVLLHLVKPCSRCTIPGVDPDTGQRSDDVLALLSRQRKRADGRTYLGQNVIAGAGVLRCGDSLERIA